MKFEKGDPVIYFRATHPSRKIEAVFLDQTKSRARITVLEKGIARTLLVPMEQLEKPRSLDLPRIFTPEPGMRGGR